MGMARLELGGAGMRTLVAALAGVVAVALCGVAVIRARTSELPVRMLSAAPGGERGGVRRGGRRVATPLRFAVQQALKGRGAVQSAASIGFQPGVEVDYPGYLPPGDPRAALLFHLVNRIQRTETGEANMEVVDRMATFLVPTLMSPAQPDRGASPARIRRLPVTVYEPAGDGDAAAAAAAAAAATAAAATDGDRRRRGRRGCGPPAPVHDLPRTVRNGGRAPDHALLPLLPLALRGRVAPAERELPAVQDVDRLQRSRGPRRAAGVDLCIAR